MPNGEGRLSEIIQDPGGAGGRIYCPPGLVPAPGQYVMADVLREDGTSDSVTALPLFSAGPAEGGFLCSGPLPERWNPGARLALRGPLGHGFHVPPRARKAALVGFDDPPARLLALLPVLMAQGAAVTLVCRPPVPEVSEEIEVQPMDLLGEVCRWADFLAVDAQRISLPALNAVLGSRMGIPAQVLVRAPMVCGAMAECGVCAVRTGRSWKMVCRDGPVFDWEEIRMRS